MRQENRTTAPKLWIILARAHRALSTLAESSIAATGLCLTDFMVLEALLQNGPLTISAIQEKVLLATGSMTAAVDRVENKGLVIRTTTKEDRRARVLQLTPEGRRAILESLAESDFLRGPNADRIIIDDGPTDDP